MPPTRPVRPTPALTASTLLLALAAAAPAARADDVPPGAPTPSLTVLDRVIALERDRFQRWRVDYHLRHDGPTTLVVEPDAVSARVAGWVSNSRAEGHAVPRRSEVAASGASGFTGACMVIDAEDAASRCRERLVVLAWPGAAGPAPPSPMGEAADRAVTADEVPALEVAPGETVRVRLLLEHEHPLSGPHAALLGARDVEVRLGPAALRDALPLDRQGRPDALAEPWPPAPPSEFLDRRLFLSAPDSLRLEAYIPERRSYRVPDYRGVVGGSRMLLSFWYLVSPHTRGRCQARLTQSRDLPGSFRALHDGEIVEELPVTGRWVRVERVFRAQPEATTLTLDLRITSSEFNVGDLWIDDLRLEPLDSDAPDGP